MSNPEPVGHALSHLPCPYSELVRLSGAFRTVSKDNLELGRTLRNMEQQALADKRVLQDRIEQLELQLAYHANRDKVERWRATIVHDGTFITDAEADPIPEPALDAVPVIAQKSKIKPSKKRPRAEAVVAQPRKLRKTG